MQSTTASADQLVSLLGATLASLARLEAAGEKPARLTDPTHARWTWFTRALGWGDYIELLHQDAVGAFPEPFDLQRWASAPLTLSDKDAELLVRRSQAASELSTGEFLRAQATALGLFAGGALSELPKVQPRDRVLELPGSAGRIAAHVADGSVSVDTQFTFIAASPAERVAIGLAIVEVRANAPTIWSLAQAEAELPKARFDKVFGFKGAPLAVEWAARFEGARLV